MSAITDRRMRPLTENPEPFVVSRGGLSEFDLFSFGSIVLPTQSGSSSVKVGFKLNVDQSEIQKLTGSTKKAPNYSLFFGLVGNSPNALIGFGVRIDFQKREIFDVVNDSGLIGWMEVEKFGHLSIDLDRIGSVILPKFEVGEVETETEEWLYPAARSSDEVTFKGFFSVCLNDGSKTIAADSYRAIVSGMSIYQETE